MKPTALRTPSVVPWLMSALVLLMLASPVTAARPDESRAQCSDGVDNDNDGLADYPDDPGCDNRKDNNEYVPVCSDGIDNDNDGTTDYPDDPDCTGPWHPHESAVPPCSDGVDNDADSAKDSEDLDCTIGDSESPCTDLRQHICWAIGVYESLDPYELNW